MAVGKLKKISNTIPLEFLRGPSGLVGAKGKDGIGLDGKAGRDGKDGVGTDGRDGNDGIGVAGKDGATPEHQVLNNEVRFMNPDGSWGDWIKSGVTNGSGTKESDNTYYPVIVAEYHIKNRQLDLGTNIFGVNFAGDVTIFLPKKVDPRTRIIVNDESASAGTNNITIKVEV